MFRFGTAISDCDVILVFSLRNQKQKSFLRAMASSEAFLRFSKQIGLLEKKFLVQRGLESVEINIFLNQKSGGRETNVEQVKT